MWIDQDVFQPDGTRMKPRRIRVLAIVILAAASVGPLAWWVWPQWHAYLRVGPLVEMLSDEDVLVRVQAAKGLRRLGPTAHRAIPALIAALSDENFNVRWRAADALGAMGPVAKASVPNLTRALKDEELFAAWAAAEALVKIDPLAAAEAGLK